MRHNVNSGRKLDLVVAGQSAWDFFRSTNTFAKLDPSIREKIVLSTEVDKDVFTCAFLVPGDRPELAQFIMVLNIDRHTGNITEVVNH